MTTFQAQNIIEFEYPYIDEALANIDISTATIVTLYLYLPDGSTKTVVGSYSATTAKNLAIALTTVTTIFNANIPGRDNGTLKWQFKVTLASAEIIWGQIQGLTIWKNLAS